MDGPSLPPPALHADANRTPKTVAGHPLPTLANLPYGTDERQVMDVWLASGPQSTPCVIHIHGGGWLGGDKSSITSGEINRFLEAGISVVAINYRFVEQTIIDTGSEEGKAPIQPRGAYPEPPVRKPLHDAARALQFVRHHAPEWNIDAKRIGLKGGSAGACTSLWLAFHDDLADPASSDPLARQSTKPWCAAVDGAQTTLDPAEILEWIPNNTYGGHAFGYVWDRSDKTAEIRGFFHDREAVKDWIAEYSPYALASAGDPPVYLLYRDGPPAYGKPAADPVHTSAYGLLLAQKLDEVGVKYEFVHAGTKNPRFPDQITYLIESLKH